jgi:hypothetical protein
MMVSTAPTKSLWFPAQYLPDMMMFLNLAVAITLLAFCWLVLVLSFKGWLVARARRRSN